MSESALKQWADPAYRRSVSERTKIQWDMDECFRSIALSNFVVQWEDTPQRRERTRRVSEGARRYWEQFRLEHRQKLSSRLSMTRLHERGLVPKFRFARNTSYHGVLFRSQAEAKWAASFDDLNLLWLYEAVELDLGSCTYRPDFFFPEGPLFVEVHNGVHRKICKLRRMGYPALQVSVEFKKWRLVEIANLVNGGSS